MTKFSFGRARVCINVSGEHDASIVTVTRLPYRYIPKDNNLEDRPPRENHISTITRSLVWFSGSIPVGTVESRTICQSSDQSPEEEQTLLTHLLTSCTRGTRWAKTQS